MAEERKSNVGELRPSQMMYTFGVGSIVDLPQFSAMVMGLDDWPMDEGARVEIGEERLLEAVRSRVGPQVQKLFTPPFQPERAGPPNPWERAERIGVPVATFPRWMLCPRCQLLAPLSNGLFELRPDLYHPDRTRYVHVGCTKAKSPPPVVPARFLITCANGHLDDFPWIEYVHQGLTDCRSTLRLIEYGASGEARELEVRCDTCGKSRRLAGAFGNAGKLSMPMCRGRRPHLRDYSPEPCDQQAKAILLGASNLWFPDVLTALSLPGQTASRLDALVEEQWVDLQHANSLDVLNFMRATGRLSAFFGYEIDEIWQAVGRRRNRQPGAENAFDPTDLKSPEWEVFTHPAAAPVTESFRLRRVDVPVGMGAWFQQIVLAENLREVRAQIGFTRLEAPGEWGEVTAPQEERRMPLSRSSPLWVPASEVRGEGIFLHFREEAIREWLGQRAVGQRDDEFYESHKKWRQMRHIEPMEANYPGLRFVLIHTFAHALMRRLVLECGYTAASLRERIYARNPGDSESRPEPMAGVLIYTAAPDSEGTLGGLVSLGEPQQLGRHIRAAFQDAQLCASDPLCAEHPPSIDGRTIHAAACHACLFAPETSCEVGNRYLDRSFLAPTLERSDLRFFATDTP